ncbi:MAG: hypothetical protein DRP76_04890, partial [Candidatus Omnitrophota bacterium]
MKDNLYFILLVGITILAFSQNCGFGDDFLQFRKNLLGKEDREVVIFLGLPYKVFPSYYKKNLKIWYYKYIYEINSLKNIYLFMERGK